MATFAKLRSGDWGIRLDETELAQATGDVVTVTRRDGQTRQATLGRQVMARAEFTLYEIANSKAEAPRQMDCATTRRTGWAMVSEELEIGACGLAAAIRDTRGRVVAAVNLSTNLARHGEADFVATFRDRLLAVAAEIERRLPPV